MRAYVPPVAILGVAIVLRFWGLGFGLPHTLTRPDEEAVFSIAARVLTGQLNPGFFDWPALYIYAVAAAYAVYFHVGRFVGWFPPDVDFVAETFKFPAPLFLTARCLSAAMGVLTVWIVYRIGSRLFDRTTALIGAFFLAVAALHVRDSHFGVLDVSATALVMVSFLFTIKYARGGSRGDAILAALWAGLAAATKYNAGLIALPGVLAIVTRRESPDVPTSRMQLAVVFCAVAAAGFLLGAPYSLLEWRGFLTGLERISDHLRRGHAAMDGWAWRIHLTSSLWYGLGWPLLAAGIGGFAIHVWRARGSALLFAMFPVLYFALIGAGQTAFARYILPVVPFLCLAAAYATVEAARFLVRRSDRIALAPVLAWSLAVAIAAPSAWSAVRIDSLLSRRDNRLLAAEWIAAEYPDGATMYQSGSTYGQVQMRTADLRANERYPQLLFDARARVFRTRDGKRTSPPRVMVVQEHPLSYSRVPDAIRQLSGKSYERQAIFPALDSQYAGLAFDWDDAFYVPLAGFDAVTRPGPNLTIYKRSEE
jgi:hypothetical protein